MKHSAISPTALLYALALSSPALLAQTTYVWQPGGDPNASGIWDTSTANANWSGGNGTWVNGATNNATFSGTGNITATLNATITASTLAVANGANVTLTANSARGITVSATTLGNSVLNIGPNVTYTASNQNLGGTTGSVTRIINVTGTFSSASGGSSGGGTSGVTIINVNSGGNFSGGSGYVLGTASGNATNRSSTTLNVNTGGSASVATGNLVLSNVANADTTVNISGGSVAAGNSNSNGVRFFASSATAINNSAATVNLDGGTLTATRIYRVATGNATGTVNFNGGTLRLGTGSNTTDYITSNLSLVVKSGGAKIDTNNQSTSIAAAFTGNSTHNGGLTKLGAGTLTLTGTNTYVGLTRVDQGTLAFSSTGSAANSSGYSLASNGASVTIGSNFTAGNSQTFTFDVGNTNTEKGTFSTGAFTLTLGTSNSLTLNITEDLGLSDGQTIIYDLFNSTGSIVGTFANLNLTGTTVGLNGATYSISNFDYSTGEATILASAIPEPASTAALAGAALLGFAAYRRRRSS